MSSPKFNVSPSKHNNFVPVVGLFSSRRRIVLETLVLQLNCWRHSIPMRPIKIFSIHFQTVLNEIVWSQSNDLFSLTPLLLSAQCQYHNCYDSYFYYSSIEFKSREQRTLENFIVNFYSFCLFSKYKGLVALSAWENEQKESRNDSRTKEYFTVFG